MYPDVQIFERFQWHCSKQPCFTPLVTLNGSEMSPLSITLGIVHLSGHPSLASIFHRWGQKRIKHPCILVVFHLLPHVLVQLCESTNRWMPPALYTSAGIASDPSALPPSRALIAFWVSSTVRSSSSASCISCCGSWAIASSSMMDCLFRTSPKFSSHQPRISFLSDSL